MSSIVFSFLHKQRKLIPPFDFITDQVSDDQLRTRNVHMKGPYERSVLNLLEICSNRSSTGQFFSTCQFVIPNPKLVSVAETIRRQKQYNWSNFNIITFFKNILSVIVKCHRQD